jgi:hypothetical protein
MPERKLSPESDAEGARARNLERYRTLLDERAAAERDARRTGSISAISKVMRLDAEIRSAFEATSTPANTRGIGNR